MQDGTRGYLAGWTNPQVGSLGLHNKDNFICTQLAISGLFSIVYFRRGVSLSILLPRPGDGASKIVLDPIRVIRLQKGNMKDRMDFVTQTASPRALRRREVNSNKLGIFLRRLGCMIITPGLYWRICLWMKGKEENALLLIQYNTLALCGYGLPQWTHFTQSRT